MPVKHVVCKQQDLPPGGRILVQIGNKSIGVFNVKGDYFALLNVCPHQFAPLCQGTICGINEPSEVGEFKFVRSGEIIRCPWHGWEFDIKKRPQYF
ncbi:MAG: Rieske (2Fe-2S) protein [Blastochloris sp.]|nr:Rieske (2Fe-2S) protein [Blastochloris sp.]